LSALLDVARLKRSRSSFVSRLTPRGNVAKLWDLPPEQHEVILAGPAETGKTVGAVSWLHERLMHNPRAQAVMVRNQQTDLYGSCVQTYVRHVLDWQTFPYGRSPDGVACYGGQKPEWFDYPNGARLWLAGLDNPGDALSSERDYIYINQAEEIAAAAYEVLLTRATGRAGNVAHPRVLGDANPGPPSHWILERERRGALVKIDTRHEDNPALFDEAGNRTAQGERTLRILDGLTGIQALRLRSGLWVSAEGTVYQLQEAHLGRHLFQPDKPTQLTVDPSNGSGPYAALVIQQVGRRVLVVGEFYQVGGIDEDLVEWLIASPYRRRLTKVISDPAKADTIKRLGRLLNVYTTGKEGKKDITAQINAVNSLMALDPVTRQAALVVDRDQCPMLIDEFGRRVWKRPPTTAPDRNVPQTPQDAHDHCLNALEYWATSEALLGLAPSGGTPGAARQVTPL
jgi:hypothetical protein